MASSSLSNRPDSSNESTPFTVAVCGGGIGGLSLAIGLLRNNVPFHIYEAASKFAEIGAGVSFGPNAVRAMALIDPQIQHLYEKIDTRNSDPSKKKTWFDFRFGMDSRTSHHKAGDLITSVYALEVGQSCVHRAHFLDALISLVPKDHCSFGKKVVNLTSLPNDQGMTLHFADSSTATASVVIGCDGIKSNLRPLLLGASHHAAKPVFTSKYAYRGLIPMDLAVAALGDERARNSQMYQGYDGHILTFPIENGKTMNVVAFQSEKSGKWRHEEWVLPMERSKMEDDYREWGDDAKKILAMMQKPDLWALFDHPPADCFVGKSGRVALMGDAAHASTPHQGAGAGMALEDAYVLSSVLGYMLKSSSSSTPSPNQISAALHAYDAVRRPRSQKLVTTSRQAGVVYEFQGEGVGDDVDEITKELGGRYGWIWEKDLREDLEEGLRIYAEKVEGGEKAGM